MITLQTEKGKETYEDLSSLLAGHPEIDEACLVYSINRAYEVTEEDETIFNMRGDAIDWEYSYIGSRALDDDGSLDGLAMFAEGYGVWDESDLFLEGTSLIGFKDGYDPDAEEFPDREWPDQGEVGCLMITKVRLPSGKEVELP